jgi:predicted AlkP superfamily pyrophosphatase or phosphodiesterase
MMKIKNVVVIDVIGLSLKHFENKKNMPHIAALMADGRLLEMKPVFPAVTLPAQASLVTGVFPEAHGVVSNGFYFPENFQIAFWEQAAGLIQTEKIWERLKRKAPELKTAVLFFQNSLYASCDAVITPKPLHTEEGLVQWCYSKPVGFYEQICDRIGEFNLFHYWGPLASIESSRWIASAAVETMARLRPNLMFVYLPHLDYCTQKFGPDDPVIQQELQQIDNEVGRIVSGISDAGLADETVFMVLSEYNFHAVQGDIALNRILRQNDLLSIRTINGREYLDVELSPAFAIVDHQIAHIHIQAGYENAVRDIFEHVDGIDLLLDSQAKKQFHIDHHRSGDLIAVSAKNRWFSYYWWDDQAKAPDFATHVDIHRKPGYDPLELFLEPDTFHISQDTSLIKGSHGYLSETLQDRLPLLISGDWEGMADLQANLNIVDVAGLIEKILTGKI